MAARHVAYFDGALEQRYADYREAHGGVSDSTAIAALVERGLDAEAQGELVDAVERTIERCFEDRIRSSRRDADAAVDKAAERLDRAAQKVAGVKKQMNVASEAALAALFASQMTLEAVGGHKWPDELWHRLDYKDRYRLFMELGKAAAFDPEGPEGFYRAWRHVEDKVGKPEASLAALYGDGDDPEADAATADKLMGLTDSYGQSVNARRSQKQQQGKEGKQQ